jgi:hypothetical protein
MKEWKGLGYIKLSFNAKPSSLQNHVHEVQGYLKSAEDKHYHRFVAITGEAVPCDNNDHIHEVEFHTDLIDGHYHTYVGKTSGAIVIGDRHVHYIDSFTTTDNGHSHGFRLMTFMNDPAGL